MTLRIESFPENLAGVPIRILDMEVPTLIPMPVLSLDTERQQQMDHVKGILNDLFQAHRGKMSGLPADIYEQAEPGITMQFKFKPWEIIRYPELLADLRIKYNTVFDMPSQRTVDNIKTNHLIQNSRRAIFDRMICRPFPKDPKAPMIIARWNMNITDGPLFLQFGIAEATESGPKYAFKAVITEEGEQRIPVQLAEETILAMEQENEYWKLLLYAAQTSLKQGKYPYACVIEPMGQFGPIIIARNKNWKKGQELDGHAENIASTAMNDMGYKIDDRFPFQPVVLANVIPCFSCCQMLREQGRNARRRVKEVKYILEQPYDGKSVLRNRKLDQDNGPGPKITKVTTFNEKALQLIQIANSGCYRDSMRGEFVETIRLNSGI